MPLPARWRSGIVTLISTATTMTAIAATSAVFGMPSVLCAAKLVSPGGLDAVACPLAIWDRDPDQHRHHDDSDRRDKRRIRNAERLVRREARESGWARCRCLPAGDLGS